jgi:single-strand DNA-binding protein
MAGSMNRVMLVGHLGADPEIRRTQDGRPIANIRMATTDSWRDKATGERRERTEWHRVVIFSEGLAKVVEQYCKKGDKILIEGSLQTRKWTDNNNVERYSTEVVLQNFSHQLILLSSKADKEARGKADEREEANAAERMGVGEQYGEHRGGESNGSSGGHKPRHDMDDEIPF